MRGSENSFSFAEVRFFGICAGLCFCLVPVSAETLSSAWEHLVSTNPALRSAEARVESGRAAVDAVNASWYPRLDLTGSYQYQSETSKMKIVIPAFMEGMDDVTIDKSLGDHDKAEVGANVSYVLFSGFSETRAAEAQEASLKSTETSYLQTKNTLALRFGLLHYAIQSARISLRLEEARFSARKAHLGVLEKRTDSGVSTSAQTLSAVAELARASADTAEAHRKLDSLYQEFESFVGVPYPEEAPPELPLVDSDSSLRSLEAEALEQRADAFLKQGAATQGGAYPQISTYVGYRYGNPGLNLTGNEWMGYAVAGVQAKWNLFDGFERKASAVRYRAESKSLRAQAEELRREQGASLKELDLDDRAS
ncbi:MAG: TolC family protein, partial [Sphaerochaetaceae bacterium]